jgi:hypothetical protein
VPLLDATSAAQALASQPNLRALVNRAAQRGSLTGASNIDIRRGGLRLPADGLIKTGAGAEGQ